MRVLVTGGTGFVGGHVVAALASRGHEVCCLVRRGSEGRLPSGATAVPGDVLEPGGLARAFAGMEAAVHLVGIIREFPRRGVTFERLHVTATRHVLAAANAAGVTRYLHMSALGARAEAPSPYHRTKWQAEELVRGSRLAWTIFRPSVIFGPGDGLVSLLAGIVGRAPVVPVIGDGQYLLQPVSVTSVAEGFALALERPETIGKTYEAGGPDRLPYERILDLIAASLGRTRPRKLHLPVAPVRAAAKLLGRFSWFPLTADQLTMLLEGNTCDPEPFHRDLGLTPRPFAGRACSQAPAPRQV